jgi:hypothetical protein
MTKLPSELLDVPVDVPFISTDMPGSGWLSLADTTLPEIDRWACNKNGNTSNHKKVVAFWVKCSPINQFFWMRRAEILHPRNYRGTIKEWLGQFYENINCM